LRLNTALAVVRTGKLKISQLENLSQFKAFTTDIVKGLQSQRYKNNFGIFANAQKKFYLRVMV
jgi:hypothetical protein